MFLTCIIMLKTNSSVVFCGIPYLIKVNYVVFSEILASFYNEKECFVISGVLQRLKGLEEGRESDII